MKFIAYILSLYILFLAMAPGVKAMYAGLSKQEQKVGIAAINAALIKKMVLLRKKKVLLIKILHLIIAIL